MATNEGKGVVCVTGGTGFIASWLIMKLLNHGYSVHATIRPPSNNTTTDITFLTSLPGASSQNLTIFEADLSHPDSFSAAIQGCAAVIHVATPGINSHTEEEEEAIVERSVNGTLGILKACLETTSVKRVVYTSGASAVVYGGRGNDVVDESFWSEVEYGRRVMEKKSKVARLLMVSKTVTERRAIEFAEEHGMDLVTLIPSIVVGPFVCPKFPGSVRLALATVLGQKESSRSGMVEESSISLVHVDDVAEAYIFLLENPEAKGRFICSSHNLTTTSDQMELETLSIKYQHLTIPALKSVMGLKKPKLSSKKLLDAGFGFKYGIHDMFDEAIQCCISKGFL
ncbi:Vestitone reductase [Linum perenne]